MGVKRLVVANGPWQLFQTAVALKQCMGEGENHLLLYTPSNYDKLNDVVDSLVEVSGLWASVTRTDSLSLASLKEFGAECIARKLRQELPDESYDALVVSKLYEAPEKILAHAFGELPVFLLEDGLSSYLNFPLPHTVFEHFPGQPRAFASYAWRALQQCSSRERRLKVFGFSDEFLGRIQHAYWKLSASVPVPGYLQHLPQTLIPNEGYRWLARKVRERVGLETITRLYPCDRPQALFLAQNFYLQGFISHEEEARIYRKAIKDLVTSGFRVLWKSHPRIEDPFYGDLQSQFDTRDLIPLDDYGAWPIELLVEEDDPLLAVGVASSSLFYLKDIYGIAACQIAGAFHPARPHMRELARLTEQCLPGLGSLTASKKSTGR